MEGQVAAGLLEAQEWARLATGSNFLTMAGSSTWMESLLGTQARVWVH